MNDRYSCIFDLITTITCVILVGNTDAIDFSDHDQNDHQLRI
jgi:hypothetical protein